ncbi:MAG: hypothetical protein AAFX85_17040 [Pseudomonadota bacterium]
MSRGVFIVLVSFAVAAATALIGWWGLVLAGLGAGAALASHERLFVPALVGGVLGWGVLLAGNAFVLGEGWRLAAAAGAVMGLNGVLFIVVTLAFAGLTTGCSAVVGRLFRSR